MESDGRVHFLSLLLGDRFRFAEGGPIFEVCQGPPGDDRPHCRKVDPPDGPRRLVERVEYEGCYVLEVVRQAEDDDADFWGDALR